MVGRDVGTVVYLLVLHGICRFGHVLGDPSLLLPWGSLTEKWLLSWREEGMEKTLLAFGVLCRTTAQCCWRCFIAVSTTPSGEIGLDVVNRVGWTHPQFGVSLPHPLLVRSGTWGWLRDRFANVGRMALTCYLLESFFMSAIMLHWGWGRFGNNTWVERAVWLLSIYALILVFANIWMSRFKLGPIEWIWRVFTYLRIPRVT